MVSLATLFALISMLLSPLVTLAQDVPTTPADTQPTVESTAPADPTATVVPSDPTATVEPTTAPAEPTTPPVETVQAPEATSTTAPAETGTSARGATSTTAPEPTATATRTFTEAPTIQSDKDDYPPGGRVMLTGGNWQPGETVHIYVNDDHGSSWSRSVDVVADDAGQITDAFNLPDWFVAVYSIRASGPISGNAAFSFTDAINVAVKGKDNNEHTAVAAQENLGIVGQSASAIVLTCPRGTGLTVRGTGLGNNQTASWTVGYFGTFGNNATLVTRTTFAPSSGTLGGSTGNDQSCVAMTINTSTLAPGNYQGQLQLSADAGNATANYFFTFSVASLNSSPAIGRDTGSLAVNEGSIAVNTGTWSDANSGDSVALSASVGTVTRNGSNSGGTWSWSYLTTDGPVQSQTVTITANDGTASTFTTFTLTVTNVAPSATFTAPSSLSEGSSILLALTSPSDPSTADTAAGFTYAFDCGSGYGSFGSTSSTSCATTDNGSRTVKGKIRDKDNGETEYTASVTITNVAPTGALASSGPITEGSSATVSFSGQADPSSADTTAGFHYAFSCANGNLSTASYAASGTTASISCPFADNGTYPVKGRIIDKDGGFTEYTTNVEVTNVAPAVTVDEAAVVVNEGQQATNSGTVSDAGLTDTVTLSASAGTVTGNGDGTWSWSLDATDGPDQSATVTITASDNDGAETPVTFALTVTNVADRKTAARGQSVERGAAPGGRRSVKRDAGVNDSPWAVSVD
jgi:hypothetical protein